MSAVVRLNFFFAFPFLQSSVADLVLLLLLPGSRQPQTFPERADGQGRLRQAEVGSGVQGIPRLD